MSRYARLLGAGLAAGAALVQPAAAAPIVGLVGGDTLIQFDSAAPGMVVQSLTVTGLSGDTLRGIDFRPATGQLYALGQAGNLFTINTVTGAASLASVSPLPVTAADLDFGFGFNPVPDRIRTVTATDKNLRSNPVGGATLTDTPLAYAAGDPNAGVNPNVTGAAYTNQVPGTVTTTTLYGIDAATHSLVLQNPPNNGVLTTIGGLGLALGDGGFDVGFDIDGISGIAYASLMPAGGATGLYTVSLTTGAASLVGGFGTAAVRDIAVGAFDVPEPATMALLGVGMLGLAGIRRRTR